MVVEEPIGCSMVVEKPSRNIEAPARAKRIRALFGEITRILNHLMAVLTRAMAVLTHAMDVLTHAMDVGALTPLLLCCFEQLMKLHERVSGARPHDAYVRPGGAAFDLPHGLLDDRFKGATQYSSRVDEIE